MKLLILGATGGTGLEIVRQAVEQGHAVTALVRSPERLKAYQEKIAVMRGNLLSSADLKPALRGQDAVLSAFGPRVPIAKGERRLLQEFAAVLIPAMERSDVKRVLVESVAFLFKNAVIPPAYLFGRLLFPSVVADAGAMEQAFQASSLEWTLIRPPQLTDRPHSGKYRIRDGHLPRFGFSISRADVADCFLRVLAERSSIQKILGVSI